MGSDTHGEENTAFEKMYAHMAQRLYDDGTRATKNKEGDKVYRMPSGQDLEATSTLWDDLFKLQGEKTAERICSNDMEEFKTGLTCDDLPLCQAMPTPEQTQTRFPVNVKWRENLPSLEEDEGYQQIAEYSEAVVALAIAAKEIVTFADETPLCLPSPVFNLCANIADALKKYDATVLKMGKALGM